MKALLWQNWQRILSMTGKKIILLAGEGRSTNIIFNSIEEIYGVAGAIIEKKESTKVFLRRRIRKLGWIKVSGQVAFQFLVAKALSLFSKKRINEIITLNRLNANDIPPAKVTAVDSVNSAETLSLLKELKPDLIIVNGTRIISSKIIEALPCRIINIHAGITPKYRGVHGMYWALANNDAENCGVTVHFIDKGVDTGGILYQEKVMPSGKDNFATYPFLQLATGVRLLHKAIDDYFANNNVIKNGPAESYLWYHPTIWYYLYKRITKGIK